MFQTDALRWVRWGLLAAAAACHATRLWWSAPPWTWIGLTALCAAAAGVLVIVCEGHVTRFVRAAAHHAPLPLDATLGRAVLVTPFFWLLSFETLFDAAVWIRYLRGGDLNTVAVYAMPISAVAFGVPLAVLSAAALAALLKLGVLPRNARTVAVVPVALWFGAFLVTWGWLPFAEGRFVWRDVGTLTFVYGGLHVVAPILGASCAFWSAATSRPRRPTSETRS